jgi:hypothetical protein
MQLCHQTDHTPYPPSSQATVQTVLPDSQDITVPTVLPKGYAEESFYYLPLLVGFGSPHLLVAPLCQEYGHTMSDLPTQ